MGEEHKVRALFELSDHSKEAFEKIKEGFHKLHEASEHVTESFSEIFKTGLGVAFGMELNASIEGVKELGHEILGAAAGLEEQEKSIRGVLMITDKAGTSLEEMNQQAHELGEEFAMVGVESGQTKDSLIRAFDEMAERTGLATADVAKLTGRMAEAGRAIPGGVDALSTGFSNLASGIVRPRNEIVKLIAATGILHGNAKQVAEQLKKMSPDKAMQLGIEAVTKMGEKMKGVPLSFKELTTSLGTLREEIFEALGTPILRALGGPLNRLKDYFVAHREEVERWATTIGEKVGVWVVAAADKMREGFEYVQSHAEEIKSAIVEGFTLAKEVIGFLWEHRKEIAALFVAKTAIGVGTSVVGAVAALGPLGMAGGAAAAAWAGAAYEATQLWKETDGLKTDAQRNYNTTAAALSDLEETAGSSRMEVERMTHIFALMGEQAGMTAAEIQSALNTIRQNADWKNDIRKAQEDREFGTDMLAGSLNLAAPALFGGPKGKSKDDAIKVPPNLNFTGPITLHQDFKDVNPDRVVVMFKQGLARSAMARVQASTQAIGTAF